MSYESIKATLETIRLGDKLSVNDWKAKYTVCGLSKHYVLAHYGQHYTIISRLPAAYNHNCVREGDYYCATDWWVFGYVNGYHFTNEDWVKEYMTELETGTTEMSQRNRAVVWFLSVVGHTDKYWAKKKAP